MKESFTLKIHLTSSLGFKRECIFIQKQGFDCQKKFQKTVIYLLICISALFCSCSEKFEDDPFIVLGPPFERITGTRKLVEFTANGRDTLSYFTSNWGDFYIDFTGTYYYNQPLLFVRNSENDEEITAGNYTLIGGGKLFLQFRKTESYKGYSQVFTIRKCTRKELIIEGDAVKISKGDTMPQLFNLKMVFKKHTP